MSFYQDESLEPKKLKTDVTEHISERRIINDGKIDQEAPPCLFYIKEDEKRVPIAAKGDLVVIAGDKKSRKSLMATAIILSRFEDVDRLKTLRFELDIQGLILYFDTEQPKRRVKINRMIYHEMAGIKGDDPHFIQYSLKGMSPHAMIEVISYVIENLIKEGNPPEMIVIDQIADLLQSRDENNKESASDVLDWLNTWVLTTGALMCVVIHTNRAGLQTNGKLGSLLDQKCDCEFILTLNKENWITELSHPLSREKRMPGIKFTHDQDGHIRFISENAEIKTYF